MFNRGKKNIPRLGEYSQPIDAQGRQTEDAGYCEPYQARKLVEKIKLDTNEKKRAQTAAPTSPPPPPPPEEEVYELARAIPPDPLYDIPPASEEDDSHHRQNSLKTVHMPAVTNNLNLQGQQSVSNKMSLPETVTSQVRTNVEPQVLQMGTEPASSSIYNEPWDSQRQQQELQQKLQQAQGGSKSNSVRARQENNYEDAWDSVEKQRQLQKIMRQVSSPSPTSLSPQLGDEGMASKASAMSRSQSSSSSNTYEDAWDTAERQRLLEEKVMAAHSRASGPTLGPGEGRGRSPTSPQNDTYLEPWDSAQKQQELAARLQATHLSVTRQGSGGRVGLTSSPVHNMSPGRQGNQENYEEAWDSPAKLKKLNDFRHARNLGAKLPSVYPSGSPSSRSHRNLPSCTIGENINPLLPLENQSWFHGNISRHNAETMLRVSKEGSYLVRESETERGQYSLSIKNPRQNVHLRISVVDGGTFILGENSREFRTIPEMIDYYTRHPVPLKGAEHITLLHPVECKWSEG